MHTSRRIGFGQANVEYILILVCLALVAITSLNLYGAQVATAYWQVVTAFGALADDFSRDLSNWMAVVGTMTINGHKQAAGAWKIKDGRMYGDPWSLNMFKNFIGGDVTIDLKGARLESQGKDWNGYGTLFRASQDSQGRWSGYGFEFEEHPKGRIQMYFSRWDHGRQTKLGKPQDAPAGFTWTDAQNIVITAKGNSFSASLNGKPLITATDKVYTSGQVGIYTNVGSAASFDGFAVR